MRALSPRGWTFPYKHNFRRRDGFQTFTSHPERKHFIFVWGDSHIEQYHPVLEKLAADPNAPGLIYATYPGCAPLPGVTRIDEDLSCAAFYDFASGVARDPRVTTVLVGAWWEKYVGLAYGNAAPYALDSVEAPLGRALTLDDAAMAKAFADLTFELKTLREQGKRIALILSNPAAPVFDPETLLNRVTGEMAAPVVPREALLTQTGPAREKIIFLAQTSNAQIIDPYDVLGRVSAPRPIKTARRFTPTATICAAKARRKWKRSLCLYSTD